MCSEILNISLWFTSHWMPCIIYKVSFRTFHQKQNQIQMEVRFLYFLCFVFYYWESILKLKFELLKVIKKSKIWRLFQENIWLRTRNLLRIRNLLINFPFSTDSSASFPLVLSVFKIFPIAGLYQLTMLGLTEKL